MNEADRQYNELGRRILSCGKPIRNNRTDKTCYTVINADMTYSVLNNKLPLITTKKVAWRAAIAEMLGYLRGYTSAAQFRSIGCHTWDANANKTKSWVNNPNRKGVDDMGYCYGAVARNTRLPDSEETYDQLLKVVKDLSEGVDDRREIVTFLDPGTFDMACLAPCMHTHTFSNVCGRLHLTSYQRSADVPLGLPFNMVQTAFLLIVMARITDLEPGLVFHKIVNAHVYEDQMETFREQMSREVIECSPRLILPESIKTLSDLEDWDFPKGLEVTDYECQLPIKYEFSE